MNCKREGLLMDEYPDRWECCVCGYTIAKLHKTMTSYEMNKIVEEMKEYYRKN